MARLTPIVLAAVSSSRIAISARPTSRRTIPAASQNSGAATSEREEVEELVVGQPQPPGRLRLLDGDPLAAAGEPVEALDQHRRGDRDRERDEREVEPAQPQRRQPERQPGGEADERRRRGSVSRCGMLVRSSRIAPV